jgi:hypothetical protein
MQSGGWGAASSTSFLFEGRPRLHPVRFGGRGGFFALTSPPPPPLALPGLQFYTPFQGKNNRFIDQEVDALLSKGAIEEVPLYPLPLLYQSHLSRSKKEWGYATHLELETECGAPQHPVLPHGDCRGCPPRSQARGLGGIHRSSKHLFSRPPPPFHKEIHVLRMERPPLSVLCAPLRPITSSKGLHSPNQIYQGTFSVRASGSGWPAAILPLSSVLRHTARGILIYSLVAFLSRFGLSAA